jgi:hypothetical protein
VAALAVLAMRKPELQTGARATTPPAAAAARN